MKPTLQLEELDNIFSMGDVANLEEEKLAQNAKYHASVVAKNIKKINRRKSNLSQYKIEERAMVISLGSKKALLCHGKKVILQGPY